MKPFQRPQSAKSTQTKQTVDSDNTTKQLYQSKLSQTFTAGVKPKEDHNNDFQKYVQQKNKDPRFKKYLETNLPKIEEKPPNTQLSKINLKPFDKKITKLSKQKKVEQNMQNNHPNQHLNQHLNQQNHSSMSFTEKNKKKMNSLKVSEINGESPTKDKPKIKFDGFTVNVPGKKLQPIIQKNSETKLNQQKQTNDKKNQNDRQSRIKDIKQFINNVEQKNMDYYPNYYQQFIERNSQSVQLEKININDFLREQPNQMDYQKIYKKIKLLDKKIEDFTVINQSSSVNLDDIITDQSEENQNKSSQIALSSISSSQLQKRNLFLTEILKGKISKEKIDQLQELDKTTVKSIQVDQEQQQLQESEISMKKKKFNRLEKRNLIEATGQIYRDCDYLSQQEKQRLQLLLTNDLPQSPFSLNQQEIKHNARIDEGIRLYRELDQQQQKLIFEGTVPKDPILKKQAELKILNEKMKNINLRLKQIDNEKYNKGIIQSIIKKYKQKTKITKLAEKIIQSKNKQFEDGQKMMQQAEKMMQNIIKNKDKIEKSLQEMEKQFIKLSDQVKKKINMNQQQLKQQSIKQIKKMKKQVQQIESITKQIQSQIASFQIESLKIRDAIRQIDLQFSFTIHPLQYKNYNSNQSIESIDKMIIQRLENTEKLSKLLLQDNDNI